MKILTLASILCSSMSLAVHAEESFSYERIASPMAPRNLQVLIEKDLDGALLEVKGPYYIFNPHDGSRVTSGLLGKRFMIHELSSGLKWGEEFPGIHQIYIRPRSEETAIFINGIQYAGAVAIYGVQGKIQIVNDVDIELYVKSKLTSQFLTPLEPEVMSALAILVRTDAYFHAMQSRSNSFWHVHAKDIGYQGSALVVPNSEVEKAVDSTRHLILLHSDTPFAATWTEHSGGKTVPYSQIFRKESYAPEQGVEAPHAALAREASKWNYQIGRKTLAHLFNLGQITALELFVDKTSSKVYGIRAKDGKETSDMDFLTLQERLGNSHIKSSDFTVTLKEDSVVFSGYGIGHGVGLCLYSASALAQNGENAVKILSKFFPDTYLYNLDAIPK